MLCVQENLTTETQSSRRKEKYLRHAVYRLDFEQQVPLLVNYKGLQLDGGYRLDFVFEKRVIVEIKAVEEVLPIHEAQLITYLKLTNIRVGLLLNFNVPILKDGIYRRVL